MFNNIQARLGSRKIQVALKFVFLISSQPVERKFMIPFFLLRFLLGFLAVTLPESGQLSASQPGTVTSVAERVAPGDTPLNLVETPDGFLISTNSGYGAQYLQAYDERRNKIADRIDFPSLWYGLAYAFSQQSVLASTGATAVMVIPLHAGEFGEPRKIALDQCELTAGIAVLDDSTAVVACNRTYEVVRFNYLTGKILQRAKVGEFPYAVKALPGGKIAVANWGQASVSILDSENLEVVRTIPVGSHPSDMLVIPSRQHLLVACSDADLVSVIDLQGLREVRRLKIQIPNSDVIGGQPNALALNPASGKLFVALAAVNALAVVNLGAKDEEPKLQGIIPAGGYPTSLVYSRNARRLFIANGHNPVTGPSSPLKAPPGGAPGSGAPLEPRRRPALPGTLGQRHMTDSGSRTDYIGYLLGGGIEALGDDEIAKQGARQRTLAQQVYGESQPELSQSSRDLIRYFSAKSNGHPPIRHVLYIIKENRTYDQVLGDMKEGDGAPDLALFGEPVTPNHHALARQFVLFDNFYVDGDVSVDGHVWSTAAVEHRLRQQALAVDLRPALEV